MRWRQAGSILEDPGAKVTESQVRLQPAADQRSALDSGVGWTNRFARKDPRPIGGTGWLWLPGLIHNWMACGQDAQSLQELNHAVAIIGLQALKC
jgi:hypothetical protein